MDLVYTSLRRRGEARPRPTAESTELAEVLGILWAHTAPADGLEHITGTVEGDRIDLLMFYLSATAATPAGASGRDCVERAAALLSRSHQASPVLHQRYLPPS